MEICYHQIKTRIPLYSKEGEPLFSRSCVVATQAVDVQLRPPLLHPMGGRLLVPDHTAVETKSRLISWGCDARAPIAQKVALAT